jgi:hypothetical protein
MQNVLLLAIPLFLSMIALEAIVGRRRGHRVYDFNETITNPRSNPAKIST